MPQPDMSAVAASLCRRALRVSGGVRLCHYQRVCHVSIGVLAVLDYAQDIALGVSTRPEGDTERSERNPGRRPGYAAYRRPARRAAQHQTLPTYIARGQNKKRKLLVFQ